MNGFDFVDNKVLQQNFNITFDHIVDLLALSESEQYKDTPILVSSLRKTIIIHTASIIEALLLWKLKSLIDSNEIILSGEWKYFDVKILHETENEEVIAGKRRKEKKDVDRIDFLRIIDFCVKNEIIVLGISGDAHKVRELRNRLHIGGLLEVEKEYTKSNLRFVFDVAKEVKIAVSK